MVEQRLAAKKDMDRCAWARRSAPARLDVLPRASTTASSPWFDRFPGLNFWL